VGRRRVEQLLVLRREATTRKVVKVLAKQNACRNVRVATKEKTPQLGQQDLVVKSQVVRTAVSTLAAALHVEM